MLRLFFCPLNASAYIFTHKLYTFDAWQGNGMLLAMEFRNSTIVIIEYTWMGL
jgi:hypothetical protein